MIRTESEYQEAVRRFRQDRDVAAQMRVALTDQGLTPEEVEAAMEPTLSHQAQLTEEMTWYENVCRRHFSPTRRLSDLGRLLIALRIANGLTQRELAQRLQVSEGIVSRDEKNEYHGITLERAQRVLDALGETITMTVGEPSPSVAQQRPAHQVGAAELGGEAGGGVSPGADAPADGALRAR